MFHLTLLPLKFTCLLFIRLAGYEVTSTYNIIQVAGTDGIFLNNSTLGVGFMISFIALILFYPGGSKKKKYWFIPLGLASIFIANAIRLSYLAINDTTPGVYLVQEQQDAFSIAMFIQIFVLWLIWVKIINKINLSA